MNRALPLAALLVATSTAAASIVTYDFAGITNVGGTPRTFTGVFQYENATPSHTVYFPGNFAPVQQGFQSAYAGGLRHLSITLSSGETVTGGPGLMHANNIQQAENGAQIPQGLSLQAYSSSPSGTINGQVITGFYLAFLPLPSAFNWDPLDSYFDGNAESMLQSSPNLLPPTIDPGLTGTALPPDVLDVFSAGVFLGTSYGLSTSVNSITSFQLRGPACDSVDFNNDGLFPDTADIDDFLSVFSGVAHAPTPLHAVTSTSTTTGCSPTRWILTHCSPCSAEGRASFRGGSPNASRGPDRRKTPPIALSRGHHTQLTQRAPASPCPRSRVPA